MTKLTSNFTLRKGCFLSTEWNQGYWVLVDDLPNLGPLESVAVSWLRLVFRGAYIRHKFTFFGGIFWCCRYTFCLALCGIWRWVIHLGFEKQGNLFKNFRKKFLKKSNVFPLLFYFTPRFFSNRSILGAPMHVSVSKMTRTYLKSEVMWMVQSRFYSLDETMAKLYGGHAM
jgi:hypothetical protein